MSLVPIVAHGACYYKVNDDSALTSDDWSMTKNLALGAAGLKTLALATYMGGMMFPILPVSYLLDIGLLYYTNTADGDQSPTESSTTNICYAASTLSLVIGALKISQNMGEGED